MIEPIPPAFLFLFGACLIPLLKGKIKQGYLLLVPVLALIDLLLLQPGSHWGYWDASPCRSFLPSPRKISQPSQEHPSRLRSRKRELEPLFCDAVTRGSHAR